MGLIKRLFGGRIEGKVKEEFAKATGIPTSKKGIISEGKRITATLVSLAIVALAGWRGYSVPEESSELIATSLLALVSAILTAWSKMTKK